MLDRMRDWFTWGKLGWLGITGALTFSAHTAGQCQSAASVVPRIEELEATVRDQEKVLARVEGYILGIADKLGVEPKRSAPKALGR